jgi:hypothetical protein
MDIRSAFPSRYLKAADLKGSDDKVVIGQVQMETISAEAQPVVYFQGKEKGLVLNKTNMETIVNMFGDETDHWIGKAITLFSTKVDFKGERKDAIRIRFVQPPPVQQHHKSEPAPQQSLRDEMDDDLPF